MSSRSSLKSAAIQQAVADLERAVTGDAGVLISGESGTGRETMARAIHHADTIGALGALDRLFDAAANARDDSRPFIVIDCSTSHDCEAAVFGRRGEARNGEGIDHVTSTSDLYRALGGTLFLKHVHDMPTRVQLRLARVLRDGEVLVDDGSPNGTLLSLRVRVVASIDPCPNEADDDRLSSELARRLPSRIAVPSVRDRREDIPGLVRNLLGEECGSMRLPAKSASQQAVALLSALPWRGNLDEMRSVLGTLALKVPGRLVRLSDVLANVRLDNAPTPFRVAGTLKEARERFEREYVAAVLEQHNGRMSEAARSLGIQRTNLYRKVRQLAVERRNGRS